MIDLLAQFIAAVILLIGWVVPGLLIGYLIWGRALSKLRKDLR